MSKKSKKLEKNSQKYKDLDYKQSKLKSALHENFRQLYKHAVKGDNTNAPFTMAELVKEQDEINKIRRVIGKGDINLIGDFKKILKNLK